MVANDGGMCNWVDREEVFPVGNWQIAPAHPLEYSLKICPHSTTHESMVAGQKTYFDGSDVLHEVVQLADRLHVAVLVQIVNGLMPVRQQCNVLGRSFEPHSGRTGVHIVRPVHFHYPFHLPV